jgi:hypothetical protein
MFILTYLHRNATLIRINNIMKADRKKVTADEILDLYEKAKKNKGVKKEEIMRRVILLSKYLNDYIPLDKIVRG